MTVMTVTGGTDQVRTALAAMVQRLTPRPPKQILSPDTTMYQVEVQDVPEALIGPWVKVAENGGCKIVQGVNESTRTLLEFSADVPFDMVVRISEAMEAMRKDGFSQGYDEAWSVGYDAGFKHGRKQGVKDAATPTVIS